MARRVGFADGSADNRRGAVLGLNTRRPAGKVVPVLAGSLREFRLADVFQLLTLSKKSGTLRIRHGEAEGRIEFALGDVAFAVTDARRSPLAARLLAAGVIDEEQLRRIVAAQAEGGTQVVAVAVEGNDDPATVLELVREHVLDAVCSLMRLEDADFSFDATSGAEVDQDRVTPTGRLVQQTDARLAEWSQIVASLPSPSSVLGLTSHPREAVSVTAELWTLVSLIDGRRTVAEICDLAGLGEFATSRALAQLVNDGVLETARDAASTTLGRLAAQRDVLRQLEERELGAPVQRGPEPAHPPPAAVAGAHAPAGEAALIEVGPAVIPAVSTPVEAQAFAPAGDQGHAAAGLPADDTQAAPAAQHVPESVVDHPAEAAEAGPSSDVDRSQVARELASLGAGDPPVAPTRETSRHDEGRTARLTRAEEVNRGLLMRLIDGVKQA